MPRPFPKDDRIAQCACGYGANGDKTAAQVNSHRAHKRYERCYEPMLLLLPDEPADRDELTEDEELDEPAGEKQPTPSRNGGLGSSVDAMAAAKPKGAVAPNRMHTGEFTPVRTAAFIAPPLLHSYFDWFVRNGYDGDFQTWASQMILDCLTAHWGLEFNVTITPRHAAIGGSTNGRHP